MITNPVKTQDRAYDLLDTFNKYGYGMFPQQRRIYEQLNGRCAGKSVLEAGCGNGLGSAMLWRNARRLVATDKVGRNVDFAHELYPWIQFGVWDIEESYSNKYKPDMVICVETLEHVVHPQMAIVNLLDLAKEELWISTPNGINKPRPPDNQFHVCEYTPYEILKMLEGIGGWPGEVEILAWDTFENVDPGTTVDPLVYKVTK